MLRSSGSFRPDGGPSVPRRALATFLWVVLFVGFAAILLMMGMIASAVVVALKIVIATLHGV